jgi:hypothetical protein
MPEVPTIAHVTLTVSNLSRSVAWYARLFEAEMFLDETPGPFQRAVWLVGGQTLVGFRFWTVLPRSRQYRVGVLRAVSIGPCADRRGPTRTRRSEAPRRR